MGRALPTAERPTCEHFEEMVRRKDDIASSLRANVHEAWALSWLAMHAFDGSRTDYSDESHREATHVALGLIVTILQEAKDRHDGSYTGVYRAVMSGTGAAT